MTDMSQGVSGVYFPLSSTETSSKEKGAKAVLQRYCHIENPTDDQAKEAIPKIDKVNAEHLKEIGGPKYENDSYPSTFKGYDHRLFSNLRSSTQIYVKPEICPPRKPVVVEKIVEKECPKETVEKKPVRLKKKRRKKKVKEPEKKPEKKCPFGEYYDTTKKDCVPLR